MQTVVRTHQGAVHGSVADEVVAFKGGALSEDEFQAAKAKLLGS
jgi:hypothetical protein